jgi:hypothetical protein
MQIKNVTETELDLALANTNAQFDGNVDFNRFEQKGKRFFVTLRVKNSHGKGAKIGFSGRHTVNACWHVHGVFFEKLLEINRSAVIDTVLNRIDKNGGNWTDKNVGSVMEPLAYSDACECSKARTITDEDNGLVATVRTVSQACLTPECWSVQFWGLSHCDTCELKGTKECGGQRIRKTGKNELGFSVPI